MSRGTIHFAASDGTIAPHNNKTLAILRLHPLEAPHSTVHHWHRPISCLVVQVSDKIEVVKSSLEFFSRLCPVSPKIFQEFLEQDF